MRTITKLETNEIIINKSKFITIITPIKDKQEINTILKSIKDQYKDATHYCFAYIIEGEEKCDEIIAINLYKESTREKFNNCKVYEIVPSNDIGNFFILSS